MATNPTDESGHHRGSNQPNDMDHIVGLNDEASLEPIPPQCPPHHAADLRRPQPEDAHMLHKEVGTSCAELNPTDTKCVHCHCSTSRGAHKAKTDHRRTNEKISGEILSPRHGSRTLLGGRVLRNRRYRRPFDDQRHTKRLFTPEIKKFLKDWLVRRRDHPYPNRDEKKRLAVQTGLTYIQICNWFANWRRKLKSSSNEQRSSWGHLIKSYNTQAQGNVEQFSICSDDSIWEQQPLQVPDEEETDQGFALLTNTTNATAMDHCYSVVENKTDDQLQSEHQPQCFQVTSTTTDEEDANIIQTQDTHTHTVYNPLATSKYKSNIMVKYLRDLELGDAPKDVETSTNSTDVELKKKKKIDGLTLKTNRKKELISQNNASSTNAEQKTLSASHTFPHSEKKRKQGKKVKDSSPPRMLSKWLESAAKFQPTNTYVPWTYSKKNTWHSSNNYLSHIEKAQQTLKEAGQETCDGGRWVHHSHHREELDAAEALTRLSGLPTD